LIFFGSQIFYVDLADADLKMIFQISRHCFLTQNHKLLMETLQENLEFIVLLFHAVRFYSFRLPFGKTKSFEKFIYGFILLMYKICIYCLLKARLDVFKVSLWINLVFGFFRVDLAFFAYDYLATLNCC